MKTASFLALLLALPVPAAYCQVAGSNAATEAQTQGSAQATGRDQSAAISQAAKTAADASATPKSVTGSAQEPTAAAPNAGKVGAGAMQTSNVSAELEKKIDSKNAKVGDEVVARTTSKAQLAQGTQLPKGTRLMGKVTEVQAKSGAQHDGHLAFTFDHAVLKDGREIPIRTTLRSISAPAAASAMGGAWDDFATAGGPVMANGGGSARAGGGLLAGGAVTPAVGRTSGLVGGATSTVGNAPGRVTGATEGTLRQAGGTLQQGEGLASKTAGSTTTAVSNMPGVSANSSASGSSTLDAHGENVQLGGGTQMVFNVSTN
jgi:hypothetical protein